jgi:DNA recombination protein RmuC
LKGENGRGQKPDVIVKLPDNRTMIVDSKVPLTAYDRLIAATTDTERAIHANQVVKDLKIHVSGLSEQRYQDNELLQAHDAVFMFVPLEGALAAALTQDPDLFTYAWDKRVVLVGPPTLLMSMKTVGSIWKYEERAENAQEIVQMADRLCDKVSACLSDLNAVHTKISEAPEAHNSAEKRLSLGKGNALTIGERIRVLTGKQEKAMPQMLVHRMSIAPLTNGVMESIAAEAEE